VLLVGHDLGLLDAEGAAAEIDPVAWIASSSAILPGPMRSPLVKSRRMLRRVSGMGPKRRKRAAPQHREPAAFVKGRGDVIEANCR